MRREVEEFAEVHDLALCQAADEEEATGVRSDVGPTRKVEVMVRVELCVRDLLRDLLRDACCVRSSVHLRILFSIDFSIVDDLFILLFSSLVALRIFFI